MRKLILIVWLLTPVAAAAYHLGPGQDQVRLDDAAAEIRSGKKHAQRALELTESEGDLAAKSEWAQAEEAFRDALELLPEDRTDERQRVRLERAKAQMMISQLPAANAELSSLVQELSSDENADPKLVRDARRAYANSQYYVTWLMRLEGQPRERWEPEIEVARQTFKLLAEELDQVGDSRGRANAEEDLESAIRLARMNLTDLQGLPLPSQ